MSVEQKLEMTRRVVVLLTAYLDGHITMDEYYREAGLLAGVLKVAQ